MPYKQTLTSVSSDLMRESYMLRFLNYRGYCRYESWFVAKTIGAKMDL